jgi:hypothetical protein
VCGTGMKKGKRRAFRFLPSSCSVTFYNFFFPALNPKPQNTNTNTVRLLFLLYGAACYWQLGIKAFAREEELASMLPAGLRSRAA